LLEVVAALHASGCFASRLYCWQQQTNQNTDDSDNHQKLDQGETFWPVTQTLFHSFNPLN
jgi:hypothetical protein